MKSITPLKFRSEPIESESRKRAPFPFVRETDQQPVAKAQDQEQSRMQQLESMLEEARSRAEIIEREAYDKAYLAGEKAGLQLGKKRGEQILASMEQILQQAEKELGLLREHLADTVFDLTAHICQQLIGIRLEQNPEPLFEALERAIRQLPQNTPLQIMLAAEEMEAFQKLLDQSLLDARLVADAGMQRGTCRIVTSEQDILVDPVAAVQQYLERIRQNLAVAKEDPANRAATSSDEPETL